MLDRVAKKFPSQEINNSLTNTHKILIDAKYLAEKLIDDNAIREVLIKCLSNFQTLFSQAIKNSDDWANDRENKTIEANELRRKEKNGSINSQESDRLKKLKRQGY